MKDYSSARRLYRGQNRILDPAGSVIHRFRPGQAKLGEKKGASAGGLQYAVDALDLAPVAGDFAVGEAEMTDDVLRGYGLDAKAGPEGAVCGQQVAAGIREARAGEGFLLRDAAPMAQTGVQESSKCKERSG